MHVFFKDRGGCIFWVSSSPSSADPGAGKGTPRRPSRPGQGPRAFLLVSTRPQHGSSKGGGGGCVGVVLLVRGVVVVVVVIFGFVIGVLCWGLLFLL